MCKYHFILAPWPIETNGSFNDIFDQTLEFAILGISPKDALQHLYKSLEFDKYLHNNTTVWVYWKSFFNGKLYPIPDYEDVNIQ